jgi:DNA-directed RNA polymerase specialized sigma subunit
MSKLTDMVVAAVEEKPDAFKTAFEDTLQDEIAQHIAAYKLQIQQGMLGVEEEVPEEEVEPTEEEIEEALGVAVEEYLEAHPDEDEDQAIAAIMGELEEDGKEEEEVTNDEETD